MFSSKLYRICSRKIFRRCLVSEMIKRSSSGVKTQSMSELFFKDSVQDLLKKLTRLDIEKVFELKKDGERFEPPVYQFMTTAEYQQAFSEAQRKADMKIQMPPVLDEREEIDSVLVKDDNLIGYSDNKYIFTDITLGINDRVRNIIVRDTDGTLREANWEERDRMNQIYFPRPGRKLVVAKMFQNPFLNSLLERGEYIFVLDSACCQFEPDDPLFIDVCKQTYLAVNSECAYNKLRSTRHYGPFVLFLTKNKQIDNLLTENIATDRLEDAVWLIQLYHIVNPDAKSASKPYITGKDLEFVQNYISEDCDNKEKLELTLQTYREYLEVPKSNSINN